MSRAAQTSPSGATRRAALRMMGVAALAPFAGLAPGAEPPAADASATPTLDRLRARGTLSVALYQDLPPFHAHGRGIDVAIAQVLADALHLRLQPLPFPGDDRMDDDLRNMVWKGHYLGYGPADVLLHVPVEPALMAANPQVRILAPYFRERLAMARDVTRVPRLEGLADLRDEHVAVPGLSLAGWLLLGADGGALRDRLTTHFKDGTEAARALQRGECAAAAGLASELESVLAGDPRYAIGPLPLPVASSARNGWSVGLAVKKDAGDLAQALQAAIDAASADGRLREIFAKEHVAWRPIG